MVQKSIISEPILFLTMNDNLKDLRTDYDKGQLSRLDLNNNPITQFSIWFDQALNDDAVIEPNGMILSTTGKNHKPSSRVVLLKGVTDSGFIFYTNYSSRKGTELQSNPYASLNFWWRAQQRQVLIEGKVEKITSEKSDEYFLSRPRGSQMSAMISPQSQVIPDRAFLNKRLLEMQEETKETPVLMRPIHWGGYELTANSIEFWQGRSNRLHDRFRYLFKNNEWKIERLAP